MLRQMYAAVSPPYNKHLLNNSDSFKANVDDNTSATSRASSVALESFSGLAKRPASSASLILSLSMRSCSRRAPQDHNQSQFILG